MGVQGFGMTFAEQCRFINLFKRIEEEISLVEQEFIVQGRIFNTGKGENWPSAKLG